MERQRQERLKEETRRPAVPSKVVPPIDTKPAVTRALGAGKLAEDPPKPVAGSKKKATKASSSKKRGAEELEALEEAVGGAQPVCRPLTLFSHCY